MNIKTYKYWEKNQEEFLKLDINLIYINEITKEMLRKKLKESLESKFYFPLN